MSDKRYPTRMHEVLGVEPNELFVIKGSEGQFYLNDSGDFRFVRDLDKRITDDVNPYSITKAINHGITCHPRLTEEAQEKEDHIIRLERMRSQKDQWANGKHAHWLETPADHAKDRDALDAAIEALTGKSRLTEEQVKRLRALIALEAMYLAKNKDGSVGAFTSKPQRNALYWNTNDSYVFYLSIVGTCLSDLVSWSDPAPLDIVQVLRQNGEEVEG